MAQAISVRLDEAAERALRLLEASGMGRSEAIRSALVLAAQRMRRRADSPRRLRRSKRTLADREEMPAIADLMETLRAPV